MVTPLNRAKVTTTEPNKTHVLFIPKLKNVSLNTVYKKLPKPMLVDFKCSTVTLKIQVSDNRRE